MLDGFGRFRLMAYICRQKPYREVPVSTFRCLCPSDYQKEKPVEMRDYAECDLASSRTVS